MYRVKLTKSALISLDKLDKPTAKILIEWIRSNLDGIENPRSIGKSLKGTFSSKWRYRKGDYRIICDIKDGELIILVVAIGHRKDIYK